MRIAFLLFSLWAVYSFSGCALMDSLRDESAQIDAEADRDRDANSDNQPDEQVAQTRPRVLQGLSANNVASYDPPVARGYGRKLASLSSQAQDAASGAQQEYRRVTREDFIDRQAHENSLWDAQGQGNYLFSNNRNREIGDLVTADVEKDLRREIQYQLWMTLPPEQRKTKRQPASLAAADPLKAAADATKSTEEKAKDAAAEAAKTNMPSETKEDDIVRMEVVENLGNGINRVTGQKRVIYRGVSRLVEVTALVNNKDVDDNNRVKSSAFLDMKTQVIQ